MHVLVNNAGLWYLMPFEKFDEEKYEKMLRVNLNGVIYMTYELLPLLKNAGNAYIGLLVEESNTLLGWGNMVEREIEAKSSARGVTNPYHRT
ncbi:SDR family NAD(P)-dependent oxidoreductase, partial [Stygiolobus sp. RP850M]|uniref:SDR family NAD(P)-dependent oxidoreductase n=1 Tax=Stygiolobus sp. RP850M TaxID=3133137 RepID=UPI00307DE59D